MSTCRGCGAEISWIRTRSGKMMPVDPEPVFVTEGGPMKFLTDEGDVISGQITDDPTEAVAFVPHWSTCPDAGSFRRRKKT